MLSCWIRLLCLCEGRVLMIKRYTLRVIERGQGWRDGMLIALLEKCRPPTGLFPNLHVFPGGHLESRDWNASNGSEELALKHCAQRETEEETGIKVPLSCINSWIQFRTPNCKQIYPTHSWDMQICVSMLFGSKEGVNRKKAEYEQDEDENEHEVAEEEQDKFREPRRSAEAVEAGWFPVDRVLQDERAGKMRLAPPQWFMLHEFITIYGGKDDAFLSAVMHKRTGWPALIQPKLTPFGRSQQWLWSVQSATTGRSVSILMDRHAGGQDGAGYFCNFQIIP